VTPAVVTALERYQWPGNVRELVNALESELGLLPAGGDTISRVPRAVVRALVASPRAPGPPTEVLPLAELERRACEDAIVRFGGNVAYAARALGVARGTLYAKMKRFGIPIPESTPASPTVPPRDPGSPH
jgi:sigma-54 dependent transcriptional regulator, acetoin dehydrogenase operon transcriptional activator AcoR